MQTQYTETQLSKLIENVEKEFTAHLAKAEGEETTLAKAEEEHKPKPEEKESKPAEAKPEAESKEEAPKVEAKPENEAPQKEEAAPAAAPQEEPCDYDQEDMEHMRKMYASMSKGELKAHHDCIAELAKCGGGMAPSQGMSKAEPKDDKQPILNAHPHDKGANLDNDPKNGGIVGQEPNNALGAKSPASDANGAKINKSEHARRNGGNIEGQEPHNSPGAKSADSDANGAKMNKSEENTEVEMLKSELSTTNAKYDDLKKKFDGVAEFLTKLVNKTAPTQKAITELGVIAKSEGSEDDKTLTKSDIDVILNKHASNPSLQKSDREAINTYYLGDKDIKGISHLLK